MVVFQDVPLGTGRGDAVGRLMGEIERRREREGAMGLLVVLPPGDSSSFGALSERVDGPWDVIRRDASVEEWRLRTQRLTSQVGALAELEDLRFRATHDETTGLLRPAEFQGRLEEQLSAAQRQGHELSLVMIDLDGFGAINKRFDHLVGDRLIERVARALRGQLRAEDLAGRMGGDEFALALPFTGAAEAARVVERVRHGVRGATLALPRGDGGTQTVGVTASLGFETFPGPGLSVAEGLRGHAELALRSAKRAGGDRGVYFRMLADADRGSAASCSR